jgi:hypothetical protein
MSKTCSLDSACLRGCRLPREALAHNQSDTAQQAGWVTIAA